MGKSLWRSAEAGAVSHQGRFGDMSQGICRRRHTLVTRAVIHRLTAEHPMKATTLIVEHRAVLE